MASSSPHALNLNLTLGVQTPDKTSTSQPIINTPNSSGKPESTQTPVFTDDTVIHNTYSHVWNLAIRLQMKSAEVQAKKNEVCSLQQEVARLKKVQQNSQRTLQLRNSRIKDLKISVRLLESKLARMEKQKEQSRTVHQQRTTKSI